MSKKVYFITICAAAIFTMLSCASSKEPVSSYNEQDGLYDEEITVDDEIEEEEVLSAEDVIASTFTEDFLGNFSPVLLKPVIFLFKSRKEMKPREISKIYLVPGNNTVEIYFRDNVNAIAIILKQKERQKIIDAAKQFLEEYESKTLKRDKPGRKNAYFVSKTGLYFGVTGYGNGTDNCEYYTNSEIFNKRAYFFFKFLNTDVDKGSGFTPNCSFYLSPSQLKDLIEILDQDYLESQIKDIQLKAYTY